jgi:hypothetical protein
MKEPKFIKVGNNDFFAIDFEEKKVYHAKIDTDKGWIKAQILTGDYEIENVLLYPSEAITAGEFQKVYSETVEKLSNETPYY